MQIHVVRPGQTMEGIARAYDFPADRLIAANQVPNAENLVPGQTLVIPIWGRYHWVQPGESLYSIGLRYDVSVDQLARINQITDPQQIQVGLRLYIPQQERPVQDISAYIDIPGEGTNEPQVIDSIGEHLTYITLFSYQMKSDGTLTPLNDQRSINTAYQNQIVPLMVITNIEEDGFSTELATAILSNEQLQNQLLDEALAIMEEKGYLGLDFDLEYLGGENRERYNQFLRKARNRLDEKGYFLSTALAPKVRADQPGVLYEGHDYAAHGEIVDFSFMMTYEWGWSGSQPMAVAPLDQVRKVMEHAVATMPRDKIMMGIPLYGYDWTLPFDPDTDRAKAIQPTRSH